MTSSTSDHSNDDPQLKDHLGSDSSNQEGDDTTTTQDSVSSSNVNPTSPQSLLKRSSSFSEDGSSAKKKPRLSLRDRISQMGSSVMSSLLPSSSSGNADSTAAPSSDTGSAAQPVMTADNNPISSATISSSRLENSSTGTPSRLTPNGSVNTSTDPTNNNDNNSNTVSTPINSTDSESSTNNTTSSSSSIMNNFINHLQNSNLHIPNHSIPSRPTATSIASLLSSPSPRQPISSRNNALPPLLHRQSSRFFPTSRSFTDASSTSTTDQATPPSSTPRIIGAPGPRVQTPGLSNTTTASGRDSAMEDQAAVLANLLAIAATATAHSLADNDRNRNGNNAFRRNMFNSSTPRPVATPTSFSNPTSVTSFDGFLAGLRNGLLTTELSNSLHDANQASPRRAMNFFRMFRFVNSDAELERTNNASTSTTSTEGAAAPTPDSVTASSTDTTTNSTTSSTDISSTATSSTTVPAAGSINGTTGASGSSTTDPVTPSTETGNAEPNLVPILIVGVRAVENNEAESTGSAQPSTPTSTEPEVAETTSNRNSSLSPQALRTRDALITAINERHGTNFPLPSETLRASSSSPASNRLSPSLSTARESSNSSFFGPPPPPPSQAASTDAPQNSENQPRQSWIVYVFGGSYPENHPILLAPTLFSDNPSYEDLMTLEAFMGQVKPPIATKDEVEKSGGLFRVGTDSAVTKDGEKLTPEGRCQICLSDFEFNEECRLLSNCKHVFHRECIDQWLTTGRNSCPLCRSEGVKKDKKFKPSVPTTPNI